MKFSTAIPTRTKAIVAAAVIAALASLVSVTAHASREATASKQAEFEASTAIQLAAHERAGHRVASLGN
jgi:hypothetical protein